MLLCHSAFQFTWACIHPPRDSTPCSPGVPTAFTKDPFMLTFAVESKDKIEGWPAQAAPAPKKRPAGAKKQ